MKYCRFRDDSEAHWGLIESVAGREMITRVIMGAPHEATDGLDELRTKSMTQIALAEAKLLSPVQPLTIICVGRNYREHAAELGNPLPIEPLLFFKPVSSLLAPGDTITRFKLSERVDYEGELAVVIGRRCRNLGESEDARPYVLGYTCLNDVTARDLQKKDGQWARAKGFDTSCPVGPVVSDELDPWTGTTVETRVNGEVRQQGNTADFIFTLDVIIRYISRFMTLMPGDVIATGTPAGVGPLQVGDVVEVTVGGVGTLRNPVADE